jgi:membrane protein DedA with SNARE-associated domain
MIVLVLGVAVTVGMLCAFGQCRRHKDDTMTRTNNMVSKPESKLRREVNGVIDGGITSNTIMEK